MTIKQELQTLLNTKGEIRQAIINKGVAVVDADTFRSYAEKIESIGGGGGGRSVAEYVFVEASGVAEFPQQSDDIDSYLFLNRQQAYKESTADTKFYSGLGSGYGIELLFDNQESECVNVHRGYPLFFTTKNKVLECKVLFQATTKDYYVYVYGTNNVDDQFNVANMTQIAKQLVPVDGGSRWVEAPVNQQYRYYCVYFGVDNPTTEAGVWAHELRLVTSVSATKCSLGSANMTPSIKVYPNDYMQVITQDWYNGSEIIPSQTLICKPYEDGGCLVNYTDDGKAVNLKMFLMTGTDTFIYILSPDDNFTLEKYSEKKQVADLNIPAHSVPVHSGPVEIPPVTPDVEPGVGTE